MDPSRTKSIRSAQRSSRQRTGTPIPTIDRTIRNGSRCVGYCNWRSPQSERTRRKNTSGGILFRVILGPRKKLRRLRQRTTSHRKSLTTMEDLFAGIPTPNNNLHGSFQFAILERTTKNQPKSSQRIPRTIGIRFHPSAHTGNNKYKSRCLIKTIKWQKRERGQ